MIKTLATLFRQPEACTDCPDKDAEVARLREALASKHIKTYPVVMANQLHLADKIAYSDKDRPWRTVIGTLVNYGWTSAGTFQMVLAAGWSWTDHLAPSPEFPAGYYKTNRGSLEATFELPGDKKFRLLSRLDLS